MACPHTTGVAAYVKSFNPSWSPAAIKSALITTAYVMSSTKNAEAELAYGAGHINPLAALSPGLIYDAQEIDYIKMLCGEGYFTTILRLVTGDQSSCASTNNGTVLDLNYPTFALQTQHGKSFSTSFRRIVTNVGVPNSTYYAIINAPSSLKINVEPKVLSFEALMEKKSFSVKLEGVAYETIISGALIWSDGTHNALVSEEDNYLLTKTSSVEEIWDNLNSMNSDSVAGPDGFTRMFFIRYILYLNSGPLLAVLLWALLGCSHCIAALVPYLTSFKLLQLSSGKFFFNLLPKLVVLHWLHREFLHHFLDILEGLWR
ncbi:cucumisin-like isoform X2 [Dendrobium catenatum]|uniref:cucumisin-like isoform X2 n=1 Tax=Dendrobium catenatum TaxID=906689 RepID=UPI0010A0B53A|nr:cucumisin-like isoform X2 [Dendrobium catenatum]